MWGLFRVWGLLGLLGLGPKTSDLVRDSTLGLEIQVEHLFCWEMLLHCAFRVLRV